MSGLVLYFKKSHFAAYTASMCVCLFRLCYLCGNEAWAIPYANDSSPDSCCCDGETDS